MATACRRCSVPAPGHGPPRSARWRSSREQRTDSYIVERRGASAEHRGRPARHSDHAPRQEEVNPVRLEEPTPLQPIAGFWLRQFFGWVLSDDFAHAHGTYLIEQARTKHRRRMQWGGEAIEVRGYTQSVPNRPWVDDRRQLAAVRFYLNRRPPTPPPCRPGSWSPARPNT